MARHPPGSAAAVLLSKWLGDLGADLMASMVGSESMTSSDWMLLALSSMGQDSQKKVGEAFVQRLLEKGDIHPAVAILLGLGEHNDAIEVYVSRKYYLEAVLLTCLIFPTDWQRQSFLVRKWGEVSAKEGKAELAVKCFSCTGIESSEPWFSPRAQDAVYAAQQQLFTSQLSPPLSPPTASNRMASKLSSLKLVTNFGQGNLPQQMTGGDEQTPMNPGVTPIAESALTPAVGRTPWARTAREPLREPSSARTATPGAYRRKRLPSKADTERSTGTNNENLASLAVPDRGQRGDSIPRTAVDNVGREAETLPFSTRMRSASVEPASVEPKETILSSATYAPPKSKEHLPSPAVGVFDNLKEPRALSRGSSRSRKPVDLHLDVKEVIIEQGPETGYSTNASPPLTGASVRSAKARGIDNYISSLEEANYYARQRTNSRNEQRPGSRPASRTTDRARSRHRDASESRGRSGARYIRPAKRSPSSPVPMSPEDAGIYPKSNKEASTNTDNFDDERFYRVDVVSPIATESVGSFRTNRSRAKAGMSKTRSSSKAARRPESPDNGPARPKSRATSRAASRRPAEDRGRSATRTGIRSPGSPQPMFREEAESSDGFEPVRPRHRSSSRRAGERARSTRREQSPDGRVPRDRSMSRKAPLRESSRARLVRDPSPERLPDRTYENRPDSRHSNLSGRSAPQLRPTTMSRKELAAKELEERRLSLARRPSAPVIPLPGEFAFRPSIVERSYTDDSNFINTMSMHRDPIQRSQTADPEVSKRYSPTTRGPVGASGNPMPMGLPANPRATRHNRTMTAEPDLRGDIPAVPSIPAEHIPTSPPAEDDLGPLLPATTFGQPVPPVRSASAPPEDIAQMSNAPRISPTFARRGSLSKRGTFSDVPNYKRVSPPPITASIDETIHESQVVIIEQEEPSAPPLLAELQHLAGPPPPPPPPPVFAHNAKPNLGVINIAIAEESNEKQEAASPISPPQPTGSPQVHRRGRGSVSENIGMTFKRVTERMRSTSRSRNKSPPLARDIAPYESIPEFSFPRNGGTKSPSENSDSQFGNLIPPPPPPPQPLEQVIPPNSEDSQNAQLAGYRNPREVRANMPPETLQQGVYSRLPVPLRANMPPEMLQPGVYQNGETPMI